MAQYNRDLDFVVTNSTGGDFVIETSEYVANDALGPIGRVKTGTGGGMLLRGVSIRDTRKKNTPFKIHIYRSVPSAIVDNASFAPPVADGDLEIGEVTINATDYITANGGAYSKAYKPITTVEVREPSKGEFYTRLENLTTVTYTAATDLKIEFWYWMD